MNLHAVHDLTGYFIYVLGSMGICWVYTILRARVHIFLEHAYMPVDLIVSDAFQSYNFCCCFSKPKRYPNNKINMRRPKQL